jgi:hypothetical protein
VTGGAAIESSTTLAAGVLRQVQYHGDAPHFGYKTLGTLVLVGTDRRLVGTGTIHRHLLGGIPFPGARHLCDAAEQRLDLRSAHQLLAPHHLVVQQPLAVFGECGGVPDPIIRAQPHKRAEHQVVVELLQEQPMRSDPVEGLQQRGQQLLGRHRWRTFCCIELA